MKIPVVYAHHSHGCAATYTIAAFERLGHTTRRMDKHEYFASNPDEYDLFFCQDSGEGIDFRQASQAHLKKTCTWFWDSAWNHAQRNPGDDEMADLVCKNGGWIFHTWRSDLDRCRSKCNTDRMSLLPVAGDPVLWPDEPEEEKKYDLSFVGNCYDSGRGNVINFARDYCNLNWPGPNGSFFLDAAKIYRSSWAVLHPPTFYQLPHDVTGQRVDLMQGATMRHYEALCCGVPLVTTNKSDFAELGFQEGVHVFTWKNIEQIPIVATRAKKVAQEGGREYARRLRQFILDNHTYEHRVNQALEIVRQAGML